MSPRGIGSVMPVPDTTGAGILDEWRAGWRWRGFRTARAALVAFLRYRNIQRIWLPSYICRVVTDALVNAGLDIGWYGVDGRLTAQTADLDCAVAGDAVLIVSYFGRSPDDGLRELASARPDLLWIEDRAQAMRPEHAAFADALLYSPRKLFGVGDGGLILTRDDDLPAASLPAVEEDIRPHLKRAADPNGLAPDNWFLPFKAREAEMDETPRAIGEATVQALRTLDAETEASVRRDNWKHLASRLASIALWPDAHADFVPLAYPVVVADAAALSAHLAQSRIWCARHWGDLPSPERFTAAHDLSRHCLSLPLDGRYGEADMTRIADAVQVWPVQI